MSTLPAKQVAVMVLTNHNNTNLQAFQLLVLARHLLGVPNPSPVSQHETQDCTQGVCADRASAIDALARQKTSAQYPTQKSENSACYY